LWVVGRNQVQRFSTRDGRLLSRRSVRLPGAAQAVSLLSGRALAVLAYPNDEIALFVEGSRERRLRFDMGLYRLEVSPAGDAVLLESKSGTFYIRASDLLAGRKRRMRRVGDAAAFLPQGGLAVFENGELRVGKRSWAFPSRGTPVRVMVSPGDSSVLVFFRVAYLSEEYTGSEENLWFEVRSLQDEASTQAVLPLSSPYRAANERRDECRDVDSGPACPWASLCPLQGGSRPLLLAFDSGGEVSLSCYFRGPRDVEHSLPQQARLFDPVGGGVVWLSFENAPEDAVLSPDGGTLYVAFPGAVRRYSAHTGRLLDPSPLALRDISSVRFSPDGASLLVAGEESLTVIDLASQRVIEQQEGGAELAIFGGEKYLLAVQNDALCARRRSNGGEVWCTPVPEGIDRLEVNEAGEVVLWHGEFDEETTRFALDSGRTLLDAEFRESKKSPGGSRDPFWLTRDAPDGLSRVWAERNSQVFLRQSEGERRLLGTVSGVLDLEWLAGGRVVAVLDGSRSLSLFEVKTGELVGRTGRTGGYPGWLFWNPERPKHLWVRASEGVSLWDMEAQKRLWLLHMVSEPRDVDVSPDGSTVAVAWENHVSLYRPGLAF
jgi:WD40 repeat protein